MAIAIVVTVYIFWRVTSLTAFGGLGPIDSIRVMRAMKQNFTAQGWRDGTQQVRGEMLAELLRNHRLRERPGAEVVAMLGQRNCPYTHDGFPCYVVVLNGDDYQLHLELEDRPPHRIADIDLEKLGR